jgi:hypothetical protein
VESSGSAHPPTHRVHPTCVHALLALRTPPFPTLQALGKGRSYEALIAGESAEKERELRDIERRVAAARNELLVRAERGRNSASLPAGHASAPSSR